MVYPCSCSPGRAPPSLCCMCSPNGGTRLCVCVPLFHYFGRWYSFSVILFTPFGAVHICTWYTCYSSVCCRYNHVSAGFTQ